MAGVNNPQETREIARKRNEKNEGKTRKKRGKNQETVKKIKKCICISPP
jgi:hypothetical protein